MGLNIRQVITQKFDNLKEYLKSFDSVAVAFSSGLESTFLLKTAKSILGNNVIALTVESEIFPKRELDCAINFCKEENIKHIIIKTDILNNEEFKKNQKSRCDICKKELFEQMLLTAEKNRINNLIEGSSFSEENSCKSKFLKEMKIKSPLKETEFSKDEIRILSKILNLETWNKQSFKCLADRVSSGEKITNEKIKLLDEGEQILFNLGFRNFRIWSHSNIARIEISRNELTKMLSHREKINEKLKILGFKYVTLDLLTY